jgi:hypothetical protein
MKAKRKLFNMTGVLAVLLLALVFGLAGCDSDGDDPGSGDTDKELAGTIHISTTGGGTAAATATVGETLYAVWTAGADDPSISYQWNDADGAVSSGGTSTTYQPGAAGKYTVTVSATGYKSKTSAEVTVTAPNQATFAGTEWNYNTASSTWYVKFNSGEILLGVEYNDNDTVCGKITGATFGSATASDDGYTVTYTGTLEEGDASDDWVLSWDPDLTGTSVPFGGSVTKSGGEADGSDVRFNDAVTFTFTYTTGGDIKMGTGNDVWSFYKYGD